MEYPRKNFGVMSGDSISKNLCKEILGESVRKVRGFNSRSATKHPHHHPTTKKKRRGGGRQKGREKEQQILRSLDGRNKDWKEKTQGVRAYAIGV